MYRGLSHFFNPVAMTNIWPALRKFAVRSTKWITYVEDKEGENII